MAAREARVGRVTHGVLAAEIDGDISLYQPDTEKVVVLNQTASDIWRLLGEDLTLGEIAELLASSYQADLETVTADVERTVAELVAAGMLATG